MPSQYPIVVGPNQDAGNADNWNGWLTNVSNQFDSGVIDLNNKVSTTLSALTSDPSDPSKLADYQKALSEYTLYRNAQSSTVKSFKDVDSTILQNLR
ncbi:type III secretion system needle complex protein [Paludibacterium paludis]|uniref:EscF/YscF/HrpA family type III secretion system needle major subunit n=1 Tax=Paludibacterium paludis TaxID=1225769 RepID=A0A918P5Z4_9NEIS|nr:type III secretion system needle complex protein [Paludibacterium paludis]GGY23894.1 EscF/YscF/HrpA family type III secretion system needle major subunit [Paludibacterium paludis]